MTTRRRGTSERRMHERRLTPCVCWVCRGPLEPHERGICEGCAIDHRAQRDPDVSDQRYHGDVVDQPGEDR